jgi:hypothetical protein
MLRRRKLLGIAPDSPASGARFVGRRIVQDLLTVKVIAVFKGRLSPNDTPVKMLLQFLLPKSSQNIFLFLCQPPNGLRYLRWGGDGEAVQPEK